MLALQNLVENPRLGGRVDVTLPINPSISGVQKPPIHIAWLGLYVPAQLHIYIMATSGQKCNAIAFTPRKVLQVLEKSKYNLVTLIYSM